MTTIFLYFVSGLVVCVHVAVATSGDEPLQANRIIGGQASAIEDTPWQVSIRVFDIHICGGSIINNTTILTAAHCLDTWIHPYAVKIQAGSAQRNSGGQVVKAASIRRHPWFNRHRVDSDIAIIKLVKPLNFSDAVRPIPLVRQNQPLRVGASALISGWGYTHLGGTVIPLRLRKVVVPIVSQQQCKDVYKTYNKVTERMFCAGVPTGGYDSCQGDSGGPVVVNNQLAGIISWGWECALPGYPGVYTRIAAFREWIDKNSV